MKRDGNLFENLGGFFVFILVFLAFGLLVFVVLKILYKLNLLRKLAIKIYDIVIFNAILRSFTQAYIVFSTSIMLNCAKPQFNNSSDTLADIVAFISAFCVLIAPIGLGSYMLKK